MKVFLVSSILQLFTLLAFAQVPQQFSFQGVARDASGKIVVNKTVSVRASIIKNTILGPTVYRETHKPTTTSTGIFNLVIGGGSQELGTLNDVDWKTGPFFLKIEVDLNGGDNYIDMGSSQFLSVPYAISSNESVNAEKAEEAVHAEVADKLRDDYPIVQSSILAEEDAPPLPNLGLGSHFVWYPGKASIRAGGINGGEWNSDKIGWASAAFGAATIASGKYSTALGEMTEASGDASLAVGYKSKSQAIASIALGTNVKTTANSAIAIGISSAASGEGSIALGYQSFPKGIKSIAIGNSVSVKTPNAIVMGIFNDDNDNPNDPEQLQRLFQIGNGKNSSEQSNALTVLKNGNIGIGKNALFPQYILDIDGRPRLRHNGATAGLFFNTSQQNADAFFGMKTDQQVGIYLADAWRFWIDDAGNANISGNAYNKSDRRLKRDFTSLSNSLSTLTSLNGYHYYWKSASSDQGLQTGLIAQEVEELFPELVTTDKEGFKAVNYIGLIPHLIEAVKELKSENDYLKKSASRLSELEASVADLLKIAKAAQSIEQQTK
ncbi:tail fiber domain-containing protein [Dyadobacter luticola]|uniref:Peptidase S74 domain-containing protein n=1 Tax=Dyadobacter luticola TaxID=1979387 RepID=A0A5R9L4V6_9BACT|nr:tail fiber domain-containing protein [Dyadobacter luticola]TLV03315.1 hypothetical protein FEN17_06800 [Dyadobacter luticola]